MPNVATLLSQRAETHAESTALFDIQKNKAWSFLELHCAASAVANDLLNECDQGDRVALCIQNGPGFVAGWFGALYAGMTTLPLSPKSTAKEISFAVDHSRCKKVLTDRTLEHKVDEAIETLNKTSQKIILEMGSLPTNVSRTPADLSQNSVAMLLYTSGTTGAAKAAMITHASLITHTHALVNGPLDLRATDRVLGVLPLAHSYGIRMTLLAPFAAGRANHLCSFIRRKGHA